MRTMVDAEQLLDWCQEAEKQGGIVSHAVTDWYDAFQKMIYRIQEVSVEVPDTPDVLGEFRRVAGQMAARILEQLNTATGSDMERARMVGYRQAWGDTMRMLDQLQAKKES